METKPSICIYFQVHQPDRLRQYRFFDIGNDRHYYDDFANRTILRRVADRCYLPMNRLLLDVIESSSRPILRKFWTVSRSWLRPDVWSS